VAAEGNAGARNAPAKVEGPGQSTAGNSCVSEGVERVAPSDSISPSMVNSAIARAAAVQSRTDTSTFMTRPSAVETAVCLNPSGERSIRSRDASGTRPRRRSTDAAR